MVNVVYCIICGCFVIRGGNNPGSGIVYLSEKEKAEALKSRIVIIEGKGYTFRKGICNSQKCHETLRRNGREREKERRKIE